MRASIRRCATIAAACVAVPVSVLGALPGPAQALPVACVRQVDISDAMPVAEGNSPTTSTVTFTVSTNACQVAGSVKFETANGDGVGGAPAEAGIDYLPSSGSLTWLAADVAPKKFDVTVLGDALPEPDEYFRALLTGASEGLVVVKGSGLATINNDDGVIPIISVAGPAYGCWQLDSKCTVDLTMSSAVPSTVTVRFDTRDGTALAGRDYVGVTGGSVIFPAGTTRAQATIRLPSPPVGDPDKVFSIVFYDPSFGTIGRNTTVVTIHRG